MKLRTLTCLTLATLAVTQTLAAETIKSQNYSIQVDTLAEGLERPWSMALLPGESPQWLVSERNGELKLIGSDGKVTDIEGGPDAWQRGQGGLLGVAVSPEFAKTGEVFIAFSEGTRGNQASTAVAKGQLMGNRLVNVKTIFSANPKHSGGRHFGGRLAVQDQCLWLTLGDRGERPSSQDLTSHTGSLLRLTFDGAPCAGNPSWQEKGAQPEIYSYGHRNIQGIAITDKGDLWTHEHGPQGGDELNLIAKGNNYGWPVITYGKNYGTGTDIGEGTEKQGMEQPVHYWVPSIAPSGMTAYKGKLFSKWNGDLLLGSLKFGLLVRLEIKDGEIVSEERLLDNQFGRIRDVAIDPEGVIYLLTDSSNGKLLKLTPQG
ncbi:PQQ-dependent sugar dehydrogenase [Shewanella submarina]|uniref:PQQ-dependent sugar dehydrogenase n=1 Tax=Shewanella submarina TaxID=2016376 RepID=A0ABV7GKU4_9GAMM|nr:PQQ-dependent sugar dehydrogenase [Shewanella submarina]MCL1036306.1 PQQ-dependent sugar dehydrogenase [Shewanella submarina]